MAFREALEQARQSVLIVGWDIDSRTQLIRGQEEASHDVSLGHLLEDVVRHTPDLEIRILIWDYAFIKLMERELWLSYKLGWKTHPHLIFRWDNTHPIGASHHQKIVVIDDQLAFCGGMDLSKWRWDTSGHIFKDDRRIDPVGNRYKPYHDVQLMVEGPVAGALGDLARERWHRSTGIRLSKPESGLQSPWPSAFSACINDAEIGISRTDPEYQNIQEVREVEQLYLDAIQQAERLIYIENQYTTSQEVGSALAESLKQEKGPEVVVVTHKESEGWLEQATMDVLRSRWIRELRQADKHDRFRIYYPYLPGHIKQTLTVHSKVMVVDDLFMRVGSSNLSNRSMGLDTECDLSLEASGDEGMEAAIAEFRHTLLGEHFDLSGEAFRGLEQQDSSLIETIERLSERDRRLEPLDGTVPDWQDRQVPQTSMIDPEKAVDSDWFRDQWVSKDTGNNAFWISFRFILMILILLGLAAAWRWTPLNQYADLDTVLSYIEGWRENTWLPFVMFSGFILGGCLGIPVTFMVVLVAIVYDPWKAFAISYSATMISSSISFFVGQVMGKAFIERYAGKKVREVSQKLARQGVLFLTMLRLIPIAPFVIINTVGGASHVRFRDFFLGTMLGSIPGTAAITFFITELRNAAKQPGLNHILIASGIGLAFVGITWLFGRWVRGKTGKGTQMSGTS